MKIHHKPKISLKLKISSSNQRIFASPLAKKIAKEKNIDLSSVTGTGENGRIVKRRLTKY